MDTLQKTGQPTNERSFIIQKPKETLNLSSLLSGYVRADGRRYFEPVELCEYAIDGVYYSAIREKYVNAFLFDVFVNKYRKLFETKGLRLSNQNRKILFKQFEILAKPFWHSPRPLTTDESSLVRILKVIVNNKEIIKARPENPSDFCSLKCEGKELPEPPKTITNKGEVER